MFRRLTVAAVVVAFAAIGVMAAEFKGSITKYEAGKSLTLKSKDGGEKTLTVSKDVKVVAVDKEGKVIDNGGKAIDIGKRLEKAGDKGLRATVITNDKDEVTEIKFSGGKKKDAK
ncbi:MAG: hypothetical protein EXR99_10615 [Gemmataceae bacterium]|nr:hypothetical protein [Gemmataceae bacterium]